MKLNGCKDCGETMIGSHKLAVNGRRCDKCYVIRQKEIGYNYFCKSCLGAAGENVGSSFALNGGLCAGCYNGKNKYNIADEAYVREFG